jgi:formylglycine-generating enzyme required for sulfatase activity
MTLNIFTSIILIFVSVFFFIPTFAQAKNTSSHKVGQTFKDCTDCPEMVVIPAENFIMGSPENEQGRYPEESPQRQINIKQFAAGKFDITKKQWAAFVKATNRVTISGCPFAAISGDTAKMWVLNPTANWNHLGFAQDSTHPAVCLRICK